MNYNQIMTWTAFAILAMFISVLLYFSKLPKRSSPPRKKSHLAGVSRPCSVRTSQNETQEDITMIVSGMYLEMDDDDDEDDDVGDVGGVNDGNDVSCLQLKKVESQSSVETKMNRDH